MAARRADESGIDLDVLLGRLDADQLAAVTAPPGPVAVLAGAGSGKTRVLTTRIAYRIATGSARAPHTVAFTFTRQAAGELRRRLAAAGVDGDVVTGTFHSVAYRILRRRWEDRGRTEAPTLVPNRLEVLADQLGGDRRLAGIAAAEIEWARARLVSPADYPTAAGAAGRRPGAPPDRVAGIYAAFETAKRRRRMLDFDDLLSECIAELRRPGAAEAVAWWHRHLHVDEFQDINPLQHAFLETLRHERDDLFVVGDPAQAIYGWNGADPTLLGRVVEGPLRPVVVHLPVNHRSTPEVVLAADAVLAANRQAAEHRAARPSGPPVRTLVGADDTDEARRIVATARELRTPGGSWASVAVLARTHDLLRRLGVEFARAGIPTRTITRAGDGAGGRAALTAARQAADTAELRAWAVDLAWPQDDLEGTPEARGALELVRAFEQAGGGSGRAFTAWANLHDTEAAGADAVELVTMHAAKGREWPAVIVAGVDTAGFPVPSSASAAARAEEARLLYVALTRATDRLVVSWAERRDGAATKRSPLLGEFAPAPEPDEGRPVAPPVDLLARKRAAASRVDPVLARLTDWRARAAHAAGVPPALVLDDETLARLAAARPSTVAELAAVPGVGPLLARRFADRLLPLLTAAG